LVFAYYPDLLASRIDRPAGGKHQPNAVHVVVARRIRQVAEVFGGQ